MKTMLCAINSQYIHSNPALYSIARAIEGMEQPPALILGQYSLNMPYDRVLEQIYKEAPDILAFSAYIWNIGYIERLLADIGRILPATLLLLGGGEATPRARELLARCPNLHGVLLGEGEPIWPLLLQGLQQGENRPAIAGVLWRDDNREPNQEQPGAADLAALPFLYSPGDLEALAAEHKIIYYESSRGCPYSCTFCASARVALRERPLELVLEELPLLAKGGGQIKFVDRTFNANPRRALAITRKVLDLYQPGLSWHFEISPYGLPRELGALWRSAPPGYLRLEAGIQSLHPPVLAAIKRGGDWPLAREALANILAGDNVHLHVDLIAGLPRETPATFSAAFEELHNLNPHYLQLGFLKVLPGSPLAESAREQNLVFSPNPPYQILQTPTMSTDYLFDLQRADRGLNGFYNRGFFRQTLHYAGQMWPGGALDFYLRLGQAMEQAGFGSLSLITKGRLLADLLLPLNAPLFEDLLRLDWLSYQDNQPVPVFLRRGDDGKNSFRFNYTWCFDESGLARHKPGSSCLAFDWQTRIGAANRAVCTII